MTNAWDGLYYYDPSSPTGLRYVFDKKNMRGSTVTRAGGIAGTIQRKGHAAFKLDGKLYSAHRVIWEMINGAIPKDRYIDHIDGVRSNNAIENLRLVTREGNARNLVSTRKSLSGVQGVILHKSGRWFANWCEDGKQRFKSFRPEQFEEACTFRKDQLLRMNNAGAGYTERHINGN